MIIDSTFSHQSSVTQVRSRWGIQKALAQQHSQPDIDDHFTPLGRSFRNPLMRETFVMDDSSR
ncbi:hypothetical protein SynA1840_02576 [Synechococcus sp. A18-40]|nr:hypothetical protein SynA1840_02576 [Synechococcus sp. A18-40]